MDPLAFRQGRLRSGSPAVAAADVQSLRRPAQEEHGRREDREDQDPDPDDNFTSASRDYTPNGVPVPARGPTYARDVALASLLAVASATDQILQSLPIMSGCESRVQIVSDWLAGLGLVLLDRAQEIRARIGAVQEAVELAPLRDMHGPCGCLIGCVVALSFAYTRAAAVRRAPRGLLLDQQCAASVVDCVKVLPQHFAVPALIDRVANWSPNSVRLDSGLPEGCAAGPAALLQAGLEWCDVKRTLFAGVPYSDGQKLSGADAVLAEVTTAIWEALCLVSRGLVLEGAAQCPVFSLHGVSVPSSRGACLITWQGRGTGEPCERLLDYDDLYGLCVESGVDEPPIPEFAGGAWDCRRHPCLRSDNTGPSLHAIVRLVVPGSSEPLIADAAAPTATGGAFPEARVRIGQRQHAIALCEFFRRLSLSEPWYIRPDYGHAEPAEQDDEDGDGDTTLSCLLAPWDQGTPGKAVQLLACGTLDVIKEAFRSRSWPFAYGFSWVVSPVVDGLACPRCPAPYTKWSPAQLFTLTPYPTDTTDT